MHNSLASSAASVTALSGESLPATPVHVLQFSADESFVNFDFALRASEFGSHCPSLNNQSQPMQHEPSGLLRNAKITVNLVRGNPILAVNQHPEGRQPLLQGDRRILEDRELLDR